MNVTVFILLLWVPLIFVGIYTTASYVQRKGETKIVLLFAVLWALLALVIAFTVG